MRYVVLFWLLWVVFGIGWGMCDHHRAKQMGFTYPMYAIAVAMVLTMVAGLLNIGIEMDADDLGRVVGIRLFGRKIL